MAENKTAQDRAKELRDKRDSGQPLTPEEQKELKGLEEDADKTSEK
jgi:hypothetical protein